jgi:hypothetical protein
MEITFAVIPCAFFAEIREVVFVSILVVCIKEYLFNLAYRLMQKREIVKLKVNQHWSMNSYLLYPHERNALHTVSNITEVTICPGVKITEDLIVSGFS